MFIVDGVTYICVRKNGIFFLATSVFNVSPSFVIELLTQLTKARPRPRVRVRPGAGARAEARRGRGL